MTQAHPADSYSEWRSRPLPEGDWTMRTGNKIPRNLYIEWSDGRSEPIGQVDTAALAAYICDTVNQSRILTGRERPSSITFQNDITGDVGTHVQARDITHLDLS